MPDMVYIEKLGFSMANNSFFPWWESCLFSHWFNNFIFGWPRL